VTILAADQRNRSEPSEITIPPLALLARRAVPDVLEGVIIPVGLFLIMMRFVGIEAAIVAALGWEGVVMGRRFVQRRRVPGIMIVTALTLTIRSALALATGSTFVYFAQPILGAACVATAFLVSVALGRPLTRRFAADYCDIPRHLHADVRIHSYYQRCSIMWAAVGFTNAGITLWLLLSQPTVTYVVAKTAVSISFTVAAVGVSVIWFRRTVTRYGMIAAV
jgi:hypothetical protein